MRNKDFQLKETLLLLLLMWFCYLYILVDRFLFSIFHNCKEHSHKHSLRVGINIFTLLSMGSPWCVYFLIFYFIGWVYLQSPRYNKIILQHSCIHLCFIPAVFRDKNSAATCVQVILTHSVLKDSIQMLF